MEKQKMWTMEEEEALCSGVEKHGQGKSKVILFDPQFAFALANYSNIDLKGIIIKKHEVAHQLSLIRRHKEGSMPTNSENEGVLPSFPMVPAPLSYVPATSNLDTVKVPIVVLRCINKDEAAPVVDDQKDFENLYEMHMSMLMLSS